MNLEKGRCNRLFAALFFSLLLAGAIPTVVFPSSPAIFEQSTRARSASEGKTEPHSAPNPQATLQQAEAALKANDVEKAGRILSALAEEDGASHFAAGKMLVDHKAFSEAATQFHLARAHYQDPYVAGFDETLAHLNAGDNAAAIQTSNELLNQGYQTAELAVLAATAYRNSGQSQQAYNALRLATHLDPKSEDAYLELCDIVLGQEKYDLGLEITKIGISNLPKSEKLYLQQGVMHAMKGQFENAQQDFSRASELAPAEVLPDISLGLIAMQMGNLPKAVASLGRAAERHPDNYLAQYWYSKALEHAGAEVGTEEGNKLLSSLESSVRLNPNFWHSRADLGKALLDRGKVDGAIVELKKAAELNPSATAPLYLLAQAYRRKGDTAKVKELIAQVSKMQNEDRESIPSSTLRSIVKEGTTSPTEDKHR